MYYKRYNGQIREDSINRIFTIGDGSKEDFEYSVWLNADNLPVQTDPEEDDLETLRTRVIQKVSDAVNTTLSNGYAFTLGSVEHVFDTSDKSLARLTVAREAAKSYLDANQPFQQKMIMKNNSVLVMQRDDIIRIVNEMFTYGIQQYSAHADLVEFIGSATREELEGLL